MFMATKACLRFFNFFLRTKFKGALSRYSVILCRFFRSKMAARRLEAAAPANEKQAFAALFFFTSFELCDQSTSGYQSVTLAKSFLSWTKMGFEIRSRKWKQKDKFAHEKWGKFMELKQACGAPRIDLELSWFEDRSRLARLSGAVAYFSLHSTMYTTIIDRQDTCWARFAWKDARPPLFFPTTKWRKKSLNSVTVHL